MITIALLAHPVRRVAGSRKPDALARMLAAMARALRVFEGIGYALVLLVLLNSTVVTRLVDPLMAFLLRFVG